MLLPSLPRPLEIPRDVRPLLLRGHVRVNRRRADVLVAKHLLNQLQVGSVLPRVNRIVRERLSANLSVPFVSAPRLSVGPCPRRWQPRGGASFFRASARSRRSSSRAGAILLSLAQWRPCCPGSLGLSRSSPAPCAWSAWAKARTRASAWTVNQHCEVGSFSHSSNLPALTRSAFASFSSVVSVGSCRTVSTRAR